MALKGQVVVDFTTELTGREEDQQSEMEVAKDSIWTIDIDKLSNKSNNWLGSVLPSPNGMSFKYAISFNFTTTNNDLVYETLLADLALAK